VDEAGLDRSRVAAVQEDLFTLGARLAAVDPGRARDRGTIPRFDSARIEALERWIDEMDEDLARLEAFVLPGGSPGGAGFHVARTVCRRAERHVVGLLDDQPDLAEVVVPYLNRLSDLLFTLARWTNLHAGVADTMWMPQRRRAATDQADGVA
jgi:cob(I)alamin adenosyltransferase